RAAGNPGGIGHAWVRRRYIEKLRPYEIRWFKRASAQNPKSQISKPNPNGARFENGLHMPPRDSVSPPGNGLEASQSDGGLSSSLGLGVWELGFSGSSGDDDRETFPGDPDALSRQFIPARV